MCRVISPDSSGRLWRVHIGCLCHFGLRQLNTATSLHRATIRPSSLDIRPNASSEALQKMTELAATLLSYSEAEKANMGCNKKFPMWPANASASGDTMREPIVGLKASMQLKTTPAAMCMAARVWPSAERQLLPSEWGMAKASLQLKKVLVVAASAYCSTSKSSRSRAIHRIAHMELSTSLASELGAEEWGPPSSWIFPRVMEIGSQIFLGEHILLGYQHWHCPPRGHQAGS